MQIQFVSYDWDTVTFYHKFKNMSTFILQKVDFFCKVLLENYFLAFFKYFLAIFVDNFILFLLIRRVIFSVFLI